jgi:hypothetical protein
VGIFLTPTLLISQAGQLTKNANLILYFWAEESKNKAMANVLSGHRWLSSFKIVWFLHPAMAQNMLTEFFNSKVVTRDQLPLWRPDQWALIPSIGPHPSWTTFLQESWSLNITTLGVKFQHMNGVHAFEPYFSSCRLCPPHIQKRYSIIRASKILTIPASILKSKSKVHCKYNLNQIPGWDCSYKELMKAN